MFDKNLYGISKAIEKYGLLNVEWKFSLSLEENRNADRGQVADNAKMKSENIKRIRIENTLKKILIGGCTGGIKRYTNKNKL